MPEFYLPRRQLHDFLYVLSLSSYATAQLIKSESDWISYSLKLVCGVALCLGVNEFFDGLLERFDLVNDRIRDAEEYIRINIPDLNIWFRSETEGADADLNDACRVM